MAAGRPKNPPSVRQLLTEIMPIGELFAEDELNIYTSLVDIYIKDFDDDELSASDLDDVMTLATNKVLEIRLLRTSKGDANRQLDITASVEKLRKQTEKIKESLSSRRKDRINPNEHKGFSIVDLAFAYDQTKRGTLESKVRQLKEEDEASKKLVREHPGNKYDVDGHIKKGNDE
ncbi:MAG TPA: hypothetical protein VI911_08145 [Patescibacteria group bacterium]|nr:hypothetical protein [Patescibacteria group bacterium]